MKNVVVLAFFTGSLFLGGCVSTAVSGTSCSTDSDCADDQLCVNGSCFSSRTNGQTPCTSDAECGSGSVCAASGYCEAQTGGQSCSVTTDCPIDQYCNFSLQDRVCAPLASGACRQASQCTGGLLCSAATGGVGRCVQCLTNSDCPSNHCNSDGTCTGGIGTDSGATDNASSDRDAGVVDSVRPDAGNCSPACNTAAGEYCVVDVCYGSNGCPLHAHAVGTGGQCACDTGWVPNTAGTACVVGTVDAGSTDSTAVYDAAYDAAYDAGSYDSNVGGTCSPTCNTAAGEFCYENVCYTAEGCPLHAHAEADGYCYCDTGYVVNSAGTGCVVGSASDAGSGYDAGDGCPANSHLESDGYCYCNDGYVVNAAGDGCEYDGGYDAGSGYDAGDGCPVNSHLESDGYCYCDDGYVVNATGDGCEYDGGGGGGNGGVGDACYSDGDCGFSYDAFCATAWPSGYCSASCYSSDDCGSSGECNCMDENCYEAYCFALCWSDYDCRDGYYCDFYSWSSASGGGFCLPY